MIRTGVTVLVDLDGDKTCEEILVDAYTRRLTITDGSIVYRSRELWRLGDTSLGDTDQNGLLEVVALLDAEDGRHLGLFAYYGGEYRERLVTDVLKPRPLSLRVLAGVAMGECDRGIQATRGDLVVLDEEPRADAAAIRFTVYRWNGFGFTALESSSQQQARPETE